ncbi:unnamed protein product [Clonostachys rosea]|uniref:Ankyrin 2,3/unc44 n=1 Tax=Bionectria ochroleuca TaxID=29856 RepID=A0ABY6UEE8_BIOOC|nr:unnamed protein product [Clonostachys rosea]
MASSSPPEEPIFLHHIIDATDEELAELIRDHPWYDGIGDPPPHFKQKPGSKCLSYEDGTKLEKRFKLLRKKTLEPPYPITKERVELAARWRRLPRSLDYDPPPPLIGPLNRLDSFARDRERIAYKLLLELGGRPVYPLHRLLDESTSQCSSRIAGDLLPWQCLHGDLTLGGKFRGEWFETSTLQLKNWERFRTWQRDHRGPNDQDTFQAFVQEAHRDWELVFPGSSSLRREETEENPMLLWNAWEKREHDRATYREHGCEGFADYAEAVRRRLDKNGFAHPFRLHQDPMQQDPLTTWIEYIAYEYWWLDYYSEPLEAMQENLVELWDRIDSHEIFKEDEAYLELRRTQKIPTLGSESTIYDSQCGLMYSPLWCFTTHLTSSRLENDVLGAKEVFRNIKSLSDIGRAQVQGEQGRDKAAHHNRSSAATKLDQLRKDCETARKESYEELRHVTFRRKYHRILKDDTRKTLEQAAMRHWQRRILDWALDQLHLIEDEIRELPGSSDIPMIAAQSKRKRARFTSAEPTVRLFSNKFDAAEPSKTLSDKEREKKRQRLALDSYPLPPGARLGSSNSSSSGTRDHALAGEIDVSTAIDDGGLNSQQEVEDERPIIKGESSGQGAAASEASSSSPRSTRSPEPQSTLAPVQPDANEDGPTSRLLTLPATQVPLGAGGEQPAITAEVPAPAVGVLSTKARGSQPTRRSARVMAQRASQAAALTKEPVARDGAEHPALPKGKTKRPLSASATLGADESRPKRRRTQATKQADTHRGSPARQSRSPSDGPGQHVPQEEESVQESITVDLSSRAGGSRTTHGPRQQARPGKRATTRANRGKRKA